MFSALPITFEPRMPPSLARRLAGRYVLALLAGVGAFALLSPVTSLRFAWAAGLVLWAGLMTVYYTHCWLRERSPMWIGVAATLAGSCIWFIALLARTDSSPLRATRIAVLVLAACISAAGILVITRSPAPWVSR